MKKVTDEPILLSPPRIKRVAQCRRAFYGDNTRSANFEVIESLFRGEDVPCCQVGVDHERDGLDDGNSSSGRVFPASVTPFPMTFEQQRQQQQHPQQVDEEVCIGGCYYNMDRKHGAKSTTTIIPTKTRARRNQCVSSVSEVCRKLYPFPFILMCALLLFGIGEILRRVSVTHGGRMV